MPDIAKTLFERHRARLSQAGLWLWNFGFVICYLAFVIGGFALAIWCLFDLRICILLLPVVFTTILLEMARGEKYEFCFRIIPSPIVGWLRALFSRSTDKVRPDG